MGKQINENFVKTYSDKQYQHTAMVNHRGTVVSFAMDDKQRIYYAVLNIDKEDKKKGTLDVKYWMDNPQQLSFPNEIEQVGFGVIVPSQIPVIKKGTNLEVDRKNVTKDEIEPFLSTTARLTADAPFQVFSDNQHIYLFRQSLAGDHKDMVHKLTSGRFSGKKETDQTKYLKDSAKQKVSIVDETLLADRYILAGTVLKIPGEVRFRRSKNKTTPASAKDSLGAKDMQGNPFFEPTKELDFIHNLSGGRFSVILLPTQIADILRWQIFAYNKSTKLIDSFNIERGEDGFFNTQGTQLYTSPNSKYKASVLERKPGICPFTKLPLVPMVSKSGYAEWALQFDSSNAHVSLGNPTSLQITGDQTIEMWIKPVAIGKRQNLFDKAHAGEGTITLETDGKLSYSYDSSNKSHQAFTSSGPIPGGSWVHIAMVRDLTNSSKVLFWYINGLPSGSMTTTLPKAKAGTKPVLIGKGTAGNFAGLIDEVRVWNRARSGSEILQTLHHRLVGDEPGLAGYWRFDEGAGIKVKDQTRNGSNGTLSGSGVKWVASDAPVGDHPGMRRTSFAFSNRDIDAGLAARLYYEQEKLSTAADAKPVKQNARVLLTAVTSGSEPNVPVNQGLVLNLSGESYRGGDQWDDLSGKGHHANKSGGNMATLHQVTDYNGKSYPVMRIKSGDRMTIADSLKLSKPFTAIIVDRYTGGAKGRTLTSNSVEANWLLGKHLGNNGCYLGGWVSPEGNLPAQDNVFSIGTVTLTRSSPNYYLDGVNKGSTGGTSAPGRLGICTYLNEVSDADIACILIWDRVLSDKERQTVEHWLGVKYGISVGHSVGPNDTTKKYVAAVDFGVSRAGKLAQVPDTISLPILLSADPGGVASTDLQSNIAKLEIDIPPLEKEIETLNSEIESLNGQLSALEKTHGSFSEIEKQISSLKSSLVDPNKPQNVTFIYYDQQKPVGKQKQSFQMTIGEKKTIQELVGVKSIRIYRIKPDKGIIASLIVDSQISSTSLHHSIESTSGDLLIKEIVIGYYGTSKTLQEADLQLQLKREGFKELLTKRTQKTQKEYLRNSKQAVLNTMSMKLQKLRNKRIGAPPPLPMRLFHSDPRGLTVSSGLLGFAYTTAQPTLFDSALGRMAMYFKGMNNQFFSAYYDVNTARAKWSLVAGSGSLTLVSRTSDREANDTHITISNGKDANHCKVILGNTRTGLTETWTDVPRAAKAFAQVLNGEAGEEVFVGKLKTSLSGAAVTTIELKDGLPREAPLGTRLIVKNSSATIKLTVSAKANSNSRQITINSATPTVSADAKVYLILYDYATKASSNRAGYTLDNGNLQVNVLVGETKGDVANGTAKRFAEAQSPQWVSDAPGSALNFNGTSAYLYQENANTFQHEGNVTMEAWVRPLDFTGDARLIHCKTPSSHYSLGLRKQAANSALSFDGVGDYVTLPTASKVGMTKHDFTVEAWIKVNPDAKGVDQVILGNNNATKSHGLHLMIRNDKPFMAFFHNDLADDSTVLAKGTWNHLAFRYTAATKEQAIFVNGNLTKERAQNNLSNF